MLLPVRFFSIYNTADLGCLLKTATKQETLRTKRTKGFYHYKWIFLAKTINENTDFFFKLTV